MQITETSSQGLKRELKVVVPAGEIGQKFNERLDEFKDRVQLKGFRRGKVPVAHIKKLYGRQLMVEVLQSTVDEVSRQALTDRNERPAVQPDIKLPESQEEIEKVLSGSADLAFDMAFEVLPKFELVDLAGLKLERLVAEPGETEIDDAVAEIAKRNVKFEADAQRAAEDGDKVTVDFLGRVDGEVFEGGTAQDVAIVIGQGGFIPGFEDGLKGAKAGDERTISATFPEAYPVDTLAGKTAAFETKVKEVAKGSVPQVDDEFAKGLGAESVAKLRELVKGQIERELQQVSRTKLKRDMLDALEKAHGFELPATLVDGEFDGVWKQVTQSLERAGKTFADEGKTEEGARAEYRKLAERRVRLGLVIGEIGEKNQIQVTQEDLRRALVERARAYPGQERFVYEYFEKTPGAINELRAPIFEEKVVDFITELAKPVERKVTRPELIKAVEAEESGD